MAAGKKFSSSLNLQLQQVTQILQKIIKIKAIIPQNLFVYVAKISLSDL